MLVYVESVMIQKNCEMFSTTILNNTVLLASEKFHRHINLNTIPKRNNGWYVWGFGPSLQRSPSVVCFNILLTLSNAQRDVSVWSLLRVPSENYARSHSYLSLRARGSSQQCLPRDLTQSCSDSAKTPELLLNPSTVTQPLSLPP